MKRSRPPLTLGWEAARANAIPAFILQGAMLLILILYYVSSTFANWLDRLAHYKQEHGLAFVVVAGIWPVRFCPSSSWSFFSKKENPGRRIFETWLSPFRHGQSMPFWSI